MPAFERKCYFCTMLDKPPIELNAQFQDTLDLLDKTNKSAFITGRAGTGKSTLLQLFRTTTKKKTVVLAPTGIAALNVKGQTIHSFFGFPPKPITKKDIKPKRFKNLYRNLEVVIIDEISMVRADMLDNIDYFLRINGGNPDLPFGGKQMVFFGDLFQLPPVVNNQEVMFFREQYESPYFFSANIFQDFELEMMELTTVYRQTNRYFIRLLDAIRTRRFDMDDLDAINERFSELPDDSYEGYITLSARNAVVDQINQQRLKRLTGVEITYAGSVNGNFNNRVFPTDLILKLREGAQVMFVKNDPKRKYVNGTIGTITKLQEDRIIVTVDQEGKGKRDIEVQQTEWEILKHKINDKNEIEADPIGTFKQYPIRLAWAITIHKSQGKTFDKVIVHLGAGAFAHGQTYVALSRCTTLEGIILKQRIRPRDVLVDERIVEYYEQHFI